MSNDNISFAELLDTPADQFQPPPVLPVGYYSLQVGKHEFGKSSKKQTPFVEFEFDIIEAGEDVDQTQLPEGYEERKFRKEFYLTGKAAYRLTQFLERCGLEVTGRSYNELIPETQGCVVMGYIAQRPSQQPGSEDMFNELTSIIAAS